MKLPNGYGSVSKLSGNRRRPYIVRKYGKPVGYAETKEKALEMLAELNKNPWEASSNATFKEVYELLEQRLFPNFSQNTIRFYKAKFKACKEYHDRNYSELRQPDFIKIIETTQHSIESKRKMLQFLKNMDKVAYDFDIIQKEYVKTIPQYKPTKPKERIPFSEGEINKLWNNTDINDVDLVLILIYTGFRSGELSELKIENINLEDNYLRGGNKTEAGKNRVIPIHHRIKPLIKNRIEQSNRDTLLNFKDKQLRVRFKAVMDKLNMKHIPHECRHTFRTRLDNLDINPNVINLLMGHAGRGIGERNYTHKTLEQLTQAIEKLE